MIKQLFFNNQSAFKLNAKTGKGSKKPKLYLTNSFQKSIEEQIYEQEILIFLN